MFIFMFIMHVYILHLFNFLSGFPKLRQTNFSFVIYIRLPVYTIFLLSVRMEHLPPDGFSWKFDVWEVFEQYVEKIQASLKSDNIDRRFTWIRLYI